MTALSPLTVALPLAIIVAIIDLISRDRGNRQRDQGQDRGSALFLWLSICATIVLVLVLSSTGPLRFDEYAIGWSGLVIIAVGVAIRAWSRVTLGRYFSVRLEMNEKQPLVEEGPYSMVRNPGYLGSILLWTGLAVSSMSGLAIILVVPILLIAYSYRIGNEEAMLGTTFGQAFDEYKKRTKRLIPFIY